MERGYFYNALKRYEKGWSEVVGLSYLYTEMTRNSVLCCCCYIHVTVVAIVMYGIFRFWSFGFILNEPSQEKNNDLHMRKTKTKISCVVTAHRGLYRHFLTLTMTTQAPV